VIGDGYAKRVPLPLEWIAATSAQLVANLVKRIAPDHLNHRRITWIACEMRLACLLRNDAIADEAEIHADNRLCQDRAGFSIPSPAGWLEAPAGRSDGLNGAGWNSDHTTRRFYTNP
jgi:hypothetical protein